MAPCALSYASDGGASMICQRGAKALVHFVVGYSVLGIGLKDLSPKLF